MSDSFWRGLKTDFARKALYEVMRWGVFALVIAVWAAAGGAHFAGALEPLRAWQWPIALTCAAAAFLFIVHIYRRVRRFTPAFGRLEFDYILVRKDIVYRRSAAGKVDYRRKL